MLLILTYYPLLQYFVILFSIIIPSLSSLSLSMTSSLSLLPSALTVKNKRQDDENEFVGGHIIIDDNTDIISRRIRTPSQTKNDYWIDRKDPFVILTDTTLFSSDEILQRQQYQQHERQDFINDCRHNDTHHEIKNKCTLIKFTIRGNPRVLIRHRSARGYTYNPSRPYQENFQKCFLELIMSFMNVHSSYYETTTSSSSYISSKTFTTKTSLENNIVDRTKEDCIFCETYEDNSIPSSILPLFSQEKCLKLSITFRMKRPKSHFIANQPGHGRLKPTAPSKLCISNLRSDIDNMTKFVMDSLNGVAYVDDRQVVFLNVRKVLDSDGLCQGATDVEISVVTEEESDTW